MKSFIIRDEKTRQSMPYLNGMENRQQSLTCNTALEELHKESRAHPKLKAIQNAITQRSNSVQRYKEKDGLVWLHDRLVLPTTSMIMDYVIQKFHDTLIIGNSRVLRTYKQVVANFFCVGMKRDIKEYIQQCDVCQRK